MYKFYIIQSLKPTDPNLGQKIFDELSSTANCEFFSINTRQELNNIFDYIQMDLSVDKQIKGVVHLHCHGNNEGIGLFNKIGKIDFIKWEELRVKFREMYVSTSKKPILSICSCEGFNVARLVPHLEPCPYEYITGSFKKIGFKISVDAYSCFYKLLIQEKSLQESVIETRTKYPKLDFTCLNNSQLFELAIEAYLKNEMIPEKISKRKLEIEKKVIAHFGFINQEQKDYLEFIFTEKGTEEQLEKFKKVFFS